MSTVGRRIEADLTGWFREAASSLGIVFVQKLGGIPAPKEALRMASVSADSGERRALNTGL